MSEIDSLNGVPYATSLPVVSIMGCQSSGKSTLLNLLFGTEFNVMDSSRGRSQTTKGVWLDVAKGGVEGMIMDLEGTDSKERGEDKGSFERQTSLFALAIAEVLMVNMWFTDIGRYSAANYDLLKAVFEVQLQLFLKSNPQKTTLLFIVRDHIEQVTPMAKLEEALLTDINNIWKDLRVPKELEGCAVTDFFDLQFYPLPHKVLMEALFYSKVNELKEMFCDKANPRYLLSDHYKKRVPVSGKLIAAWGRNNSNQGHLRASS